MGQLTFYTVDTDKPGYPVKYMHPDNAWHVKHFTGNFGDLGEASQEFKAAIAGEHCYLDATTFKAKASALARLRKQQEQQELATR